MYVKEWSPTLINVEILEFNLMIHIGFNQSFRKLKFHN